MDTFGLPSYTAKGTFTFPANITTSKQSYNIHGCREFFGNITLNEVNALPDNVRQLWSDLYKIFVDLCKEDEEKEDEENEDEEEK